MSEHAGSHPNGQHGLEFDQDELAGHEDGMITGGPRPTFAPSDEEMEQRSATNARPSTQQAGKRSWLQNLAKVPNLENAIPLPEELVEAAKDPDLTGHESLKAVEAILANFKQGLAVDDAERTLILEAGPLGPLEGLLRGRADDLLAENVADVYKTAIRRAVHEAVISTPVLTKNERSVEALDARVDMLNVLQKTLEAKTTSLQIALEKADAKGVGEFSSHMYGVISAERRKIEAMKKNASVPTLGAAIFEGLKTAFGNLGKNELVGDARRHRNKQLSGALDELDKHAHDLKTNAGNAEWERTEGVMARKAVGDLTRRVQDLVEGVADQVDGPALRKNLDNVQEMLQSASTNSTDAAHKKALEAMVERMRQMVQTLMDGLGRIFGRSRETPTPKPA